MGFFPESPGCLDERPQQNRNVGVSKIDGFQGVAYQAICFDATVDESPLTSLLDQPIPIGSLMKSAVKSHQPPLIDWSLKPAPSARWRMLTRDW
jgi:hypothetical protein